MAHGHRRLARPRRDERPAHLAQKPATTRPGAKDPGAPSQSQEGHGHRVAQGRYARSKPGARVTRSSPFSAGFRPEDCRASQLPATGRTVTRCVKLVPAVMVDLLGVASF